MIFIGLIVIIFLRPRYKINPDERRHELRERSKFYIKRYHYFYIILMKIHWLVSLLYFLTNKIKHRVVVVSFQEGGDIYYISPQSFIISFSNFWLHNFVRILIVWFIKLSVQTLEPL